MDEKDYSIVERSNVQTDCIVVNQCKRNSKESFTFQNKRGEECTIKYICTTERGLSRSRNMAIANAPANSICLLCDDDEYLDENYESTIIEAYKENNASVIAFVVKRADLPNKVYFPKICRLTYRKLMSVSSVQITFRHEDIIKQNITFDIMLGSGTGNGAGEENKFLIDCFFAKLKMLFVPKIIAEVLPLGKSNWFKGYDDRYFINDGWSNRRVHGSLLSLPYIFYYIFSHRKIFEGYPILRALRLELKGWMEKRIL